MPLWPSVTAWNLNGSTVSGIPIVSAASGATTFLTTLGGDFLVTLGGSFIITDALAPTVYGFSGAASDGASGLYFPQYVGNVLRIDASGNETWVPLPPGRVCTGIAYAASQAAAYVALDNGSLGVVSGAAVGSVTPSFASVPAWGMAVSGSTLFTVLPSASGIGTMALTSTTSGVTGVIATPMSYPICTAASTPASSMAAGGWDYAALASGYTDLSFDPAAPTNMLAVRPSSNAINLYTGVNESWSILQTLSGTGAPTRVAWAQSGLFAMVTDPTSGRVAVVNYSAGTISSGQVITVSGAGQVGILSTSLAALVCQPGLNQVTSLFFASGVWASGAPVALAQATSLVMTSATTAAVGFASGIAYLGLAGAVWSVSASASLGFLPSGLATNASGIFFAAGTLGASGMLSICSGATVQQTLTWSGSGNSVLWRQGQIVVGDPANALLLVFGKTTSIYAQASTTPAPAALNQIVIGSSTLFAAGSGTTAEFNFTAPYRIEGLRTGKVSIYKGGAWATATLGVGQWPEALAFDVSGNAYAATLQNMLYSISSGGTILSSGAIVQNGSQPQTTPIGTSALIVSGSSLYASSSLDGAIVKVL